MWSQINHDVPFVCFSFLLRACVAAICREFRQIFPLVLSQKSSLMMYSITLDYWVWGWGELSYSYDYVCNMIQDTCRLIIILDLDVVRKATEVRKKLGEPREVSVHVTEHDHLKSNVLTEIKQTSSCNSCLGKSNNCATHKGPSLYAEKAIQKNTFCGAVFLSKWKPSWIVRSQVHLFYGTLESTSMMSFVSHVTYAILSRTHVT